MTRMETSARILHQDETEPGINLTRTRIHDNLQLKCEAKLHHEYTNPKLALIALSEAPQKFARQ